MKQDAFFAAQVIGCPYNKPQEDAMKEAEKIVQETKDALAEIERETESDRENDRIEFLCPACNDFFSVDRKTFQQTERCWKEKGIFIIPHIRLECPHCSSIVEISRGKKRFNFSKKLPKFSKAVCTIPAVMLMSLAALFGMSISANHKARKAEKYRMEFNMASKQSVQLNNTSDDGNYLFFKFENGIVDRYHVTPEDYSSFTKMYSINDTIELHRVDDNDCRILMKNGDYLEMTDESVFYVPDELIQKRKEAEFQQQMREAEKIPVMVKDISEDTKTVSLLRENGTVYKCTPEAEEFSTFTDSFKKDSVFELHLSGGCAYVQTADNEYLCLGTVFTDTPQVQNEPEQKSQEEVPDGYTVINVQIFDFSNNIVYLKDGKGIIMYFEMTDDDYDKFHASHRLTEYIDVVCSSDKKTFYTVLNNGSKVYFTNPQRSIYYFNIEQ